MSEKIQIATFEDLNKFERDFTHPFPEGSCLGITEGWYYSERERKIHRVPNHKGIDYQLKPSTPVLAVADGFAISSSHFYYLKKGEDFIGFALGNFVQIYHPHLNLFTSYGHLKSIETGIVPYVYPRIDQSGKIPGYYPHYIVNSSIKELLEESAPVKQGQPIGTVGTSGLTINETETPLESADIQLSSWDELHVHLETYIRYNDGKKYQIDPYNQYSRDLRQYPEM